MECNLKDLPRQQKQNFGNIFHDFKENYDTVVWYIS